MFHTQDLDYLTSFSRTPDDQTPQAQDECISILYFDISGKLPPEEPMFRNRYLTLTRPIGLPPHTPVAQKIADKR